MKKIVFFAAALMASMFVLTSCEKENVAEMAENNAASALKPANFVLIQKGYVDENGCVGDLYYNESDPKCRCLVLYEQQTRAHQQPNWSGTLDPIYVEAGNPDSGIHSFFCNEQKEATNCNPTSDGWFKTSVDINKILLGMGKK